MKVRPTRVAMAQAHLLETTLVIKNKGPGASAQTIITAFRKSWLGSKFAVRFDRNGAIIEQILTFAAAEPKD